MRFLIKNKKLFITFFISIALLLTLLILPDFSAQKNDYLSPVKIAYAAEVIRTSPLYLSSTSLSYTDDDGTTKTFNPTTTSMTCAKEGWAWDISTYTLTIDGATFNTTGSAVLFPTVIAGTTLNVVAKNSTFTVSGGAAIDGYYYNQSNNIKMNASFENCTVTATGVLTYTVYDGYDGQNGATAIVFPKVTNGNQENHTMTLVGDNKFTIDGGISLMGLNVIGNGSLEISNNSFYGNADGSNTYLGQIGTGSDYPVIKVNKSIYMTNTNFKMNSGKLTIIGKDTDTTGLNSWLGDFTINGNSDLTIVLKNTTAESVNGISSFNPVTATIGDINSFRFYSYNGNTSNAIKPTLTTSIDDANAQKAIMGTKANSNIFIFGTSIPITKRTDRLTLSGNTTYVNFAGESVMANLSTADVTDSAEGWIWYATAADGYSARTLILYGANITSSTAALYYGDYYTDSVFTSDINSVNTAYTTIVLKDNTVSKLHSGANMDFPGINFLGNGKLDIANGSINMTSNLSSNYFYASFGSTTDCPEILFSGTNSLSLNRGKIDINNAKITVSNASSYGINFADGIINIGGNSILSLTASSSSASSSAMQLGNTTYSPTVNISGNASVTLSAATGFKFYGSNINIGGDSTVTITSFMGSGIDGTSGNVALSSNGTLNVTSQQNYGIKLQGSGIDSGVLSVIDNAKLNVTAPTVLSLNDGNFTFGGNSISNLSAFGSNGILTLTGNLTVTDTATFKLDMTDNAPSTTINGYSALTSSTLTVGSTVKEFYIKHAATTNTALYGGTVTANFGTDDAYVKAKDGERAIYAGTNYRKIEMSGVSAEVAAAYAMPTTPYISGTQINISAGTKDYYDFINWTTTNGGSFGSATSATTTYYVNSQSIQKITANFALTDYTITYNLDGGSISPEDTLIETYNYGDTFTLPSPTKTGYVFSNWTIDGIEVSQFLGTESGDVAITANYKYIVTIPTLSGEYTFNGSVQNITFENYINDYMSVTYSVDPAEIIFAGNYTATFSLLSPEFFCWADNTIVDKVVNFTINKASFDMTGVTFSNKTFIFDNTEKSIAISGSLPDEVMVHYENNNKILIGEYEVGAFFVHDNPNYNDISPMTAKIIIIAYVPPIDPILPDPEDPDAPENPDDPDDPVIPPILDPTPEQKQQAIKKSVIPNDDGSFKVDGKYTSGESFNTLEEAQAAAAENFEKEVGENNVGAFVDDTFTGLPIENTNFEEIYKEEISQIEKTEDGKFIVNGQTFDNIEDAVENVKQEVMNTIFNNSITLLTDSLLGQIHSCDGKLVSQAVNTGANEIDSLTLDTSDRLKEIYSLAVDTIDVSKNIQKNLEDISELVSSVTENGKYTQESLSELNKKYNQLKKQLVKCVLNSEVDALMKDWQNTLDSLKVSNITLEDENGTTIASVSLSDGLNPDLKVEISQYDDTTPYEEQIGDALLNNKIKGGLFGIQSIEDKQLKGVFDISLSGDVTKNSDDTFTVKIKKPESLDGFGQITVVHIKKDGAYEYLKAKIVGDYLVFDTKDFSDFAIYAKTPGNLTYMLIPLAVIAMLIAAFFVVDKKHKE